MLLASNVGFTLENTQTSATEALPWQALFTKTQPECKTAQISTENETPSRQVSAKENGPEPDLPSDLRFVIDAWSGLPEHVKTSILAAVRDAANAPSGGPQPA